MGPGHRRNLLIVAALTALAALVRFPGLGDQNLWYDEVFSLHLSTRPVAEIVAGEDGHPPLYHLLEKSACAVLGVDYCGRALSAALGVLTIPLFWSLAYRMFDARVAHVATLILAISPFHAWYSREGRMYALVVLWPVLSSLCLPGVIAGSAWSAIGFAIATLGGLLSHYAYVAVAAAQLGFVLLAPRTRRIRRSLLALAVVVSVAGAIAAALTPALREVAGGPIGPSRRTELLGPVYALFTFFAGFGVGPSVRTLQRNSSVATLTAHWPALLSVGALLGLASVQALRAMRDARPWAGYVLAWILVPFVIVTFLSVMTGLAFNPRYVIGALPAFVLLLALGIARGSPRASAVILAGIVATSAVSLARDRLDPDYGREQIREAAQYIASTAMPADTIYYGPLYLRETVAHYLPADRSAQPLPSARILSDEQVEKIVSMIRPRNGAVWLLRSREWSDDPNGLLARRLAAQFPAAVVREFAGVRVYRFDPAPEPTDVE